MKPKQELQVRSRPGVDTVFESFPEAARKKLLELRRLIVETAVELEAVSNLEEALKWGEPSYLTKIGSTIRIGWKEDKPDQYAMYFTCTTSLVPAFRIVYNGVSEFEGNRAIILKIDGRLPEPIIKKCIEAGLTYHKVRHSAMLGL
jgi:hypothetical protein